MALQVTSALTFQELLFRLQTFWAERGCVLQQPYDVEVGAGTMSPETFLRVLDPRPFSVAYAQPSRRPADGRYGENPNRLFKHTQFQVVLKPPPANVQEIYLESLTAIGVDLRQHDLKFEEDNWESPTLGAWGIGWQVMLDGLEITQFTYFQQCGGLDLDPISAEITYGLERIAAFLQDVDSVYDVIATHFFLDCFTDAELDVLVENTARSAAPGARWIVSEFRPATFYARLLIPVMYAFFRGATGLATRRLADHHPHLLRNGFRLWRVEKAWGGMLASELWVR